MYEGGMMERISVLVDPSLQWGSVGSNLVSASVSTPGLSHCSSPIEEEENMYDMQLREGFNSTVIVKTASAPVQWVIVVKTWAFIVSKMYEATVIYLVSEYR